MEVPIRASRLSAILNILGSDGKLVAATGEMQASPDTSVSHLLLTLLAESAAVTGISLSNGVLKLSLSARVTEVLLDEEPKTADLASVPTGAEEHAYRVTPPDRPDPPDPESCPDAMADLRPYEPASGAELLEDLDVSSLPPSGGEQAGAVAKVATTSLDNTDFRDPERSETLEELDDPVEIGARPTGTITMSMPTEQHPRRDIVLEDLD